MIYDTALCLILPLEENTYHQPSATTPAYLKYANEIKDSFRRLVSQKDNMQKACPLNRDFTLSSKAENRSKAVNQLSDLATVTFHVEVPFLAT